MLIRQLRRACKEPIVWQPQMQIKDTACIARFCCDCKICMCTCRGAVDKEAITRGAGVASSSRYGSVIAGTLVAAVVVVGLAGTVLVWRRRAGAYQGLHDTEMAMMRREH